MINCVIIFPPIHSPAHFWMYHVITKHQIRTHTYTRTQTHPVDPQTLPAVMQPVQIQRFAKQQHWHRQQRHHHQKHLQSHLSQEHEHKHRYHSLFIVGISGALLSWFYSYLFGRKFYIIVQNYYTILFIRRKVYPRELFVAHYCSSFT